MANELRIVLASASKFVSTELIRWRHVAQIQIHPAMSHIGQEQKNSAEHISSAVPPIATIHQDFARGRNRAISRPAAQDNAAGRGERGRLYKRGTARIYMDRLTAHARS